MRTDAALVHEILSELVANSATFTPRGGRITIAGRLLPGGDVEVTVRDTGPGIAPEELPLAGERFGRGAGAMGFPGAGLGLGVAGALAERLGGRLAIDPGPGGRARLQLPAAPAAAAAGPGGRGRRAARHGWVSGFSMKMAPGEPKTMRPSSHARRQDSRKPHPS